VIPAQWHEQARQRGVELLVPARPGYGRSDPVEMDAVARWPHLLGPALEHAEIVGPLRVCAASAGAAYALALAAAMGDRVDRVAVLSGVSHVADPTVLALYEPEDRARYAAFAVDSLDEIAAQMRVALGPLVQSVAGDAAAEWGEALEAALAHDGIGPAREAQLQIRPWGFELAAVTQPVRWWHARDDEQVPYAAAAATVAKLPGGTLVTIEEGGHLRAAAIEQEALDWLAADVP
jgi:pimeloyl-ACP methyl ester carboxylesterase